ncbi:hypothetical protein [Faecalibacterium prausnitzii]|jgi:hypothetical protein|uniref:hypothetical protein n=1 Tax=Faecalibacterium prausnitzii TaxID=853 RepID=UPI0022E4E2CA|nr:hypothetical protein [Faecalibacterium prausnitzii]
MKKLARLTALLLTGALLLVLTACGAETEQQAKKRLLKEINSYRASIHLDSLDEVEELSAAEQELIEHFRAAGKTVLPESEGDEALDRWESKTTDWSYCSDFGPGWGHDKDGKLIYILSANAKVPANTPEGNAELRTTLGSSGDFNCKDCKSIGIAVVTIDGQMYWSCAVYD